MALADIVCGLEIALRAAAQAKRDIPLAAGKLD
jgi:hypothetical protein